MIGQVRNEPRPGDVLIPNLQLVAWEITRSCNLYCSHCRASAVHGPYSGELSTNECFKLLDDIATIGKPIIILTGGEPLNRPDVFDIAKYAVGQGLRVVMGSNGTLITEEIAQKLKEIPLSRIAISLDFPTPKLQDEFRGKSGAFASAVSGIKNSGKAGIEVQINCTLTKLNVPYLDRLLSLALDLGAVAFHPFLLVPTGRGKGLESVELSPQQYEDTLNWIYDRQKELAGRMLFKPTDAPHYLRVMKQRQKQDGEMKLPQSVTGHSPVHSVTRGCLAGIGFSFISHQGKVQGCGYLDVAAGDVRKQAFTEIWANSPLFNNLRQLCNIKGKCGICEYKRICGGCRARAYESTGDYLEAEPYCIYQPQGKN